MKFVVFLVVLGGLLALGMWRGVRKMNDVLGGLADTYGLEYESWSEGGRIRGDVDGTFVEIESESFGKRDTRWVFRASVDDVVPSDLLLIHNDDLVGRDVVPSEKVAVEAFGSNYVVRGENREAVRELFSDRNVVERLTSLVDFAYRIRIEGGNLEMHTDDTSISVEREKLHHYFETFLTAIRGLRETLPSDTATESVDEFAQTW